MVITDLDLDNLGKPRLGQLKALKLDWCFGFSTDGLFSITKLCSKLFMIRPQLPSIQTTIHQLIKTKELDSNSILTSNKHHGPSSKTKLHSPTRPKLMYSKPFMDHVQPWKLSFGFLEKSWTSTCFGKQCCVSLPSSKCEGTPKTLEGVVLFFPTRVYPYEVYRRVFNEAFKLGVLHSSPRNYSSWKCP